MGGEHLSVRIHFVWSTVGRVPVLTPTWAPRLYQHMRDSADDIGATVLAVGGMPDHVHLLVAMPPTLAIGDFVDRIKTKSGTWLRSTFRPRTNFRWQENYGAFSVSKSLEPQVIRYIQNQPRHHRTVGYQAEFRALLEKHGVEYDESTVWE